MPYVAGATPLNRHTQRDSADIDVFHDREERVAGAAMSDTSCIRSTSPRTSRAAAGPREVRDLVDLVTIHDTILSLAVIWAAVEKSHGLTP